MDPRIVFLKTQKGETEIVTRTNKLNHALRYVLILVNGKSTVGEIMDKGAGLPKIELALDMLATQGFIYTLVESKQTSQASLRDPKSQIIALAQTLLGDDAKPIIKKLRESDNSPDALAHTTNMCKRLIKLTIDDVKAEDFVRRAQEIIFSSTIQLPPPQQEPPEHQLRV